MHRQDRPPMAAQSRSPATPNPKTGLTLAHHLSSPVPSPTPLRRLRAPSSSLYESAATSRDHPPAASPSGRAISRRARCAEVAGGAAASCTAVCCCCPCGLLNLLFLALVRLPAGLCRKAVRKRRLKRMIGKKKKMPTMSPSPSTASSNSTAAATDKLCRRRAASRFHDGDDDDDDDAGAIERATGRPAPAIYTDDVWDELHRELRDRFHKTGFWRSPSLKEP